MDIIKVAPKYLTHKKQTRFLDDVLTRNHSWYMTTVRRLEKTVQKESVYNVSCFKKVRFTKDKF